MSSIIKKASNAVVKDDAATLRLCILDDDWKWNLRDEYGRPCLLHEACEAGSLACVVLLLASVPKESLGSYLLLEKGGGGSILHCACAGVQLEVCRYLLTFPEIVQNVVKKGRRMSSYDDTTCLDIVSRSTSPSAVTICRTLLELGHPVGGRDGTAIGKTCLDWALESNSPCAPEIIKYCDDDDCWRTAPRYATGRAFMKLVRQHSDVAGIFDNALAGAALAEDPKLFDFLFEKYPHESRLCVNNAVFGGWTPLLKLARSTLNDATKDCLRSLVSNGAEVPLDRIYGEPVMKTFLKQLSDSSSPPLPKQPEKKLYPQAMKTLKEMGFQDTSKLQMLLQRYEGSIDRALADLIH